MGQGLAAGVLLSSLEITRDVMVFFLFTSLGTSDGARDAEMQRSPTDFRRHHKY